MAEQAWYKTHALKLHVIKKHRYRYNTNISNFLALGLQKLYHIPKLCWNSISDGCNFLYISMKINKSLARYKFTYLISYRLDYVLHVGVYWKQICSFINDIKRAAFWRASHTQAATRDISIVTLVAMRVVREIRKLFSVNRYLTNRPIYGTSVVTSRRGGMRDKRRSSAVFTFVVSSHQPGKEQGVCRSNRQVSVEKIREVY